MPQTLWAQARHNGTRAHDYARRHDSHSTWRLSIVALQRYRRRLDLKRPISAVISSDSGLTWHNCLNRSFAGSANPRVAIYIYIYARPHFGVSRYEECHALISISQHSFSMRNFSSYFPQEMVNLLRQRQDTCTAHVLSSPTLTHGLANMT